MSYLETPAGRDLAESLFELGAVRFGEFRLKLHEKKPDAPLSPFFFNLRTPDNPKPGPLDAESLKMIAEGFRWLVDQNKIHFAAVSGIPNAGDPIAHAFVSSRPSRTVRLIKTGDDATGRRITDAVGYAEFSERASILLMDDVITQADTKVEAVEVLRRVGLEVSDLLVIIDREQGGVAQIAKQGVRVHSLFGTSTLVFDYINQGHIGLATYDRVIAYLAHETRERAVADSASST